MKNESAMDPKIVERFWSKVEKTEGCWNWTGDTNGSGYGRFWPTWRKWITAHRFAYKLLVGPIPDGKILDHLCENKVCVRPDHVRATTHAGNVLRGKGPTARNARKTTCKRGHPLSGENLKLYKPPNYPRALRVCRACVKIRDAARYV